MPLYVVSTPIGNLEDITLRALEVLKKSDLILSEDTRETEKILQKWDIKTPQISYREENHNRVISRILKELELGKSLALVSDSGTPVISDPGFQLIRRLYQIEKETGKKALISTIPGPSAATSALSVSGLPADNFTFLGFLPKKASQRAENLVQFGDQPSTLIIYESPYRVKKLLNEILDNLGNRTVCLTKDLTKKYEDIKIDTVKTLLENEDKIVEKGEYVILVAKKGYKISK